MRDTSLEAYNYIRDTGILSRGRWNVYDVLFRCGPLTASEALKQIESENGHVNWNTHARFSELRDMGAVYETGIRPCRISGMRVIAWDVTSAIPKKREKPKVRTWRDVMNEIIVADSLECARDLARDWLAEKGNDR